MKKLFNRRTTLILIALAFSSLPLFSWALGVDSSYNWTDVSVDRYTLNGNSSTTEGQFRVKKEIGDLYKNGNFIPIGISADQSIQIDQAGINAISGKFVMPLALWTQHKEAAKPAGNPNAMRYFPRSTETYSINGVPYVIVTAKESSEPTHAKPVVSINAVQSMASENGPVDGRFMIALNSAISTDIAISYSIKGKAKNGKDYEKIANKVVIPAGNVSIYVDISPLDDSLSESTETVALKLRSSRAYKLDESKSATIEITDND